MAVACMTQVELLYFATEVASRVEQPNICGVLTVLTNRVIRYTEEFHKA